MKLQLLEDLYESGGLSHHNNLSIQGIVEGKVARMICTGTKEELVVLSDKTGYLVTRLSAEDLAKREKAERRTHWAKIVAGWFESEEKRPPIYRTRDVDKNLGRKMNPLEWYDAHYRAAVEAGALFQIDMRAIDPDFLPVMVAHLGRLKSNDSNYGEKIKVFFPTESARIDAEISVSDTSIARIRALGSTLGSRLSRKG